MELRRHSGSGMIEVFSTVLSISQSGQIPPCNPLDITSQESGWVVYCIDSSRSVYACDMTINVTSYSNTELECRFLDSVAIQDPSDFLFIPNDGLVFFVDGSVLYSINPRHGSLEEFAYLSRSSCKHLDYIPHNLVILYCEPGVATEVDFDRIEHMQNINKTGVTFVCERSDQVFVVKQNRQRTEVVFNNQSVLLNGTSFLDAKCILQEEAAFIFVVDAYAGVSMLNGASLTIHQIPVTCSIASPCRSIQIYAQPTGFVVIVLKEVGGIEAMMFDETLCNVLTIELRESLSGFTPLFSSQVGIPSSTTAKAKNGDDAGNNKSSNGVDEATIGAILAVTAFIIVLVVAIIAAPM